MLRDSQVNTRLCTVGGCDKPLKAKGLCGTHYWRMRTHGRLGSVSTKNTKKTGVPCEISGCTRLSIGDGLCRMHYERRRKGKVIGPSHSLRRESGEGYITKAGYKMVGVNGHLMLEHRRVMEVILGRRLLSHETVHHKNGNRLCNDPSNLELWSTKQPYGQRIEDKVRWALQIIALYGALVSVDGESRNTVDVSSSDVRTSKEVA